MKLTHVGISNFRSIGETPVMIDLTKKINVLVGANNCGKSNVLRAICSFGTQAKDELDRHQRSKDIFPTWYIRGASNQKDHRLLSDIGEIMVSRRQTLSENSYPQNPFAEISAEKITPFWLEVLESGNPFQQYVGRRLTQEDLLGIQHKSAAWTWAHLRESLLKVVSLPQFRRITRGKEYSIEGAGVIETLADWQSPKIGEEANLEKLAKVTGFLRRLTLDSELHLGVDRDRSMIIVRKGKLSLPLDSYGTGIHELIILAIAVLSHDNALVCIEEPEIHLHPLLQRRFLDFLRSDATTNGYILTTHSPVLIAPNDDTAVTHLWLENGVTQSRRIETTGHSLEALRDLGAKASDLLQANSVIWVEGPSDRIYLKRWLDLLYPGEFHEGIDYAVMFYGGRLLAHVSLDRDDPAADTTDADDLVHLLRINQHSAILIDSDRRKKTDPINATKLRIQQECDASKILCWITDGREIENYLSSDALAATYADAALAGSKPEIQLLPFQDIESALKKSLSKTWPRANYYDQSKPQMARRIVPHLAKDNLSPELVSWMEKLARVIRHNAA